MIKSTTLKLFLHTDLLSKDLKKKLSKYLKKPYKIKENYNIKKE